MIEGGNFTIPFRVPGLNDYINVCRTNKYKAAKFKSDIEDKIGYFINRAVAKGELQPIEGKCIVRFIWTEENKKRDADNIQSGQKFILDTLQKQGILKNDSRKYVVNTLHDIIDEKGKSKVEVHIMPRK